MGSFLILAVKQRVKESIQFLTGNHPTLVLRDSRKKKVTMVEPNARDPTLGRTALYEACLWGDEDAVHWIIDYAQGWQLPFTSLSTHAPHLKPNGPSREVKKPPQQTSS